MMNRKGKINGNIYDVVTHEEYLNNKELCDNKFTAIEHNGLLYPITKNKNVPGYYNGGDSIFAELIQPPQEELENYSSANIIDFNSASTMKEYMEKSMTLRNMEKEILCSPDNKFHPVIAQEDDEVMKALKEAVILKDIDIDKYESRFGSNFNNDKRLFKKHTVSLGKLKTMADNLDMRATLTLEDKSPDVPNPMGRVITVEITGGDYDEE